MTSPHGEGRPAGNGAASKSNTTSRVPACPDIPSYPNHVFAVGLCGCERPGWHERGCLWGLDPEHRVQLAAALALDPFRAPQVDPDAECRLLARVHADVDYARRVAAWITSAGAAA